MLKGYARLRGRSWSEFRVRGTQAIEARAERLRLWLGVLPGYEVSTITPESLVGAIDSVLSLLGGTRQRPAMIVEAFARADSTSVDRLRSRARQLRSGHVQILGLSVLDVGLTPDWHCDAASGLVAPRRHWSQIPYLDAGLVGDHKSLWELNRHQYLFAPAIAWLADGQAEDFELVQRHISSWLTENPPAVGVNWVSSLEVAYRAITWCWLLWLLQEAPWEKSVLKRLGGALERSALHVERYLSIYFSPNTHFTGEALALFYLGSLLPASPDTARWRAKGAHILESWLDRQVLPDGTYAEQASLYHRYTTEIYLHYSRIAAATHHCVSADVYGALNGLFDVMRSVASGNAQLPLIGDDDGGYLLPLDQHSPEEVAGLLLAGAAALARSELVPEGVRCPAMAYALCGVNQTIAICTEPPRAPRWRNRYFPDGGVAVLRDGWAQNDAVAVIDAGPHGILNCGHAHADALSMTLTLGMVPLFVDRGTLTYMGAERNEFRSTESHNTLEFDGESSVRPRGAFHWHTVPDRATGRIADYGNVALFIGLALGHADSPCPSRHHRAIVHVRGGAWLVVDRGCRENTSSALVRWQLAAGLHATVAESVLWISDLDDQPVAQMVCVGAQSLRQSVRNISLRYGHECPATVIEAATGKDTRLVSLIVPAGGTSTAPRLQARREPQATLVEWVDDGGSHQLWVPDSPSERLAVPGKIWVEAQALWMTADDPEGVCRAFEPDRLVALGAQLLVCEGTAELVTSNSAGEGSDVVASRQGTQWTILPGIDPSIGS